MQVASGIRDAGGEAISVPGDVTAEDFAPKIMKATIDKYGALHILINNAGDSLVSVYEHVEPFNRFCRKLQATSLLAITANQPFLSHNPCCSAMI